VLRFQSTIINLMGLHGSVFLPSFPILKGKILLDYDLGKSFNGSCVNDLEAFQWPFTLSLVHKLLAEGLITFLT
jgi:hypothetical protein